MRSTIELEQHYCAHNYQPLPVVITRGEGIYLWDDRGKRYIDMMSAYSAVSLGHSHPRIRQAIKTQVDTLSVVSRAFYSDQLAPFAKTLCELTDQDMILPMNTGAEAVETAIKATRKWAYQAKGVTPGKARIIACNGNFHGRTISIISFSSEDQYKHGFEPLTPGFDLIPFNNVEALEQAITADTAAFLVEPVQGEGGIIIPDDEYLQRCADVCKKHNVLLICDEIQTGLGRTGKMFAYQHAGIKPDGLILGKALGGGVLPVSAFLSRRDVMEIFTPGDHGSTFGGNPLACHVAQEALQILQDEKLVDNSAHLGEIFIERLKTIPSPAIKEVRGKGLFIGLEIDPGVASAREVCEQFLQKGLLSKETHETVVRLAPPLTITRDQLDDALKIIDTELRTFC